MSPFDTGRPTRRVILQGGAALAASGLLPRALRAQAAYPDRTITLIVPFTPGGSTDVLARLLGNRLETALGQTVVIESRPGAGGTIGVGFVAKAEPDGYTLVMGHIGTLAVAPSLYANLAYDPDTDFAPISGIANVHNMLVVHPDVPAQNLAEFIEYAKGHPGEMNYASGGNGSAAHIAMVALADSAGIELQHVPYKGTGPAVTDLLAGAIQATFTGAPNLLQYVASGQLRALAVSGAQRLASAPDVPTVAESGFPGFEASQWYGILAPAGTPPEVVTRLNREIVTAMAEPSLIEQLAEEGADVWTDTPDEFRAHIAAEEQRWGALVRKTGIRMD